MPFCLNPDRNLDIETFDIALAHIFYDFGGDSEDDYTVMNIKDALNHCALFDPSEGEDNEPQSRAASIVPPTPIPLASLMPIPKKQRYKAPVFKKIQPKKVKQHRRMFYYHK